MQRRSVLILAALGSIALLITLFFAWTGVMGDHFEVVDAGRFYRSGRMDGAALRKAVTANGIRSIVNLCGKQSGKDWYDDEVALCTELGLAHADVRMNPDSPPDPSAIRALVSSFDSGPYPILVHCGGGADRAGFAAALYEIVVKGADEQSAVDSQLSWRDGHLPFLGFEQLDRFFAIARGRPAGVDFRTFALCLYEPDF